MNTGAALRRAVRAVAVGASAGGVEAFGELLPALPKGLPIPVFVVQHLAPERPSLLVELFANRCSLTVVEGLDKMPVEPGIIYIAPPDYHLLVDREARLALSVDEPVLYSRPSIDVLFESAADCYGAGLLGVLLTGANEDGAGGLKAVHAAGGQTVVQNPSTAQVAIMPAAALSLHTPTLILNLKEIADLFKHLAGKCA